MKSKQTGFSLVELLVVVAIIVILAGISLPAILQFLRTYRIQGAAQQVAGELQAARTKAIMRNVNRGVLFLIMPDPVLPIFNRYQWVLPEQVPPQPPPAVGTYNNLAALLVNPAQAGPVRVLPDGVNFVFGGGNTQSIGFTRLGGTCDPAAGCGNPAVDPTGVISCLDCINFNAGNMQSTLILNQPVSGLTRTLTIMTGGRVLTQ